MRYNFNYDVASILAGAFILSILLIRRTLKTKSNRLIVALLLCNLLGAAFDIASCYSICYPRRYSWGFNYFTTLGYLFFYNLMGVLFLAYIDSKTKIKELWKPVKIYCVAISIFEGILIVTSPYTHLVSYFDERNIYNHGPLMILLYAMAALHLFTASIMIIIKRRRFNRYQVVTIVAFVVVIFLGVLIQAIYPYLLVGQFGCTLVLYFLYSSLENPAYYTYKGTSCFNKTSFLEYSKYRLQKKEFMNLYAFGIKDYDYFKESLSLKNLDRLSCNVAEFINSYYGGQAFCIADDKFIIMLDKDDEEYVINARLTQYFANPIDLVDTSVALNINYAVIRNINPELKIDMIENALYYILDNESECGEHADFENVVEKIRRKKRISHIIKEAISNNGFNVYYQPILNVSTGTFTSVEALVRLINDELGFISPEEFIPIAENEGLILQIGETVFEKVCSFIKESDCINKLGVHYIEINLSPIQCLQPDITKRFKMIMDRYDVNPKWINLEITETASFEQNDIFVNNINEFHNMGVEFSIDDYGSGFASADYLFRLPVNIVKIDKGILWQAMKDDNAGIVLICTLSMIKMLGKKIVVEGAEDEHMVKLLVDNGVDYIQGYFYSKPLPEKDYVDFLLNHNL